MLPDVSVIRDLYEVRIGLEHLALSPPVPDGHRARAATVCSSCGTTGRRCATTTDIEPDPDFVLLDESFHVGLAEAAGNPAVVEMLTTVNERIRIVRMQDFLTEERIVQTIEQHLGILEAVLDRDLASAMARFDGHLQQSLDVVEERAPAGRVPHDPH